MYTSDLLSQFSSIFTLEENSIQIVDSLKLREEAIDKLADVAIFSSGDLQKKSRWIIRKLSETLGILPSSTYEFYRAIGEGKVHGFTVPAINIRTLTYDFGRLIFQLAKKNNIGAFIFEIARSEQQYTSQTPDDFATCILAAAIKEDWVGPVFLQCDHYQVNALEYHANPDGEMGKLRSLTADSLAAQFYNVDIDGSTLVDIRKPSIPEQQRDNSYVTASLTNFIQENQPQGISVSIGGEIGHIGDKNSTSSDFTTFMEEYLRQVQNRGINKVSVQTGSSHGGIPLPDGSLKEVTLDFPLLESIGKLARDKYHMAGVVQHGASTLPKNLFPKFPDAGTLEIHLSTGFQNIIFDNLPKALLSEMDSWVTANCQSERKPEWNNRQFFYKLRKKSLGPFRENLCHLSGAEKQPILKALETELLFIFEALRVFQTREIVEKYTLHHEIY